MTIFPDSHDAPLIPQRGRDPMHTQADKTDSESGNYDPADILRIRQEAAALDEETSFYQSAQTSPFEHWWVKSWDIPWTSLTLSMELNWQADRVSTVFIRKPSYGGGRILAFLKYRLEIKLERPYGSD